MLYPQAQHCLPLIQNHIPMLPEPFRSILFHKFLCQLHKGAKLSFVTGEIIYGDAEERCNIPDSQPSDGLLIRLAHTDPPCMTFTAYPPIVARSRTESRRLCCESCLVRIFRFSLVTMAL